MLLEFVASLFLFCLVGVGLAWPLAARLSLDPAEKLAAYLFAFAVYVLDLPRATFLALPLVAAAGLIMGRRTLVGVLGDRDARALLIGQLLLIGWSVGWLLLIVSYSGGGWAGDWFEHWERTRFFLLHLPRDIKLLGVYPLPARPPLANLVTGALLAVTGATFSGYQLVTTLLNCLVFLPAALLARRFCLRTEPQAPADRSRVVIAVLVALLMVNPSFVENTTFAWTKLITAFFILSALYFFLRTQDSTPAPAAAPLCAASLAGGLLAHYSAGPYVLLLVAAWFALGHRRWRDATFWRQTAVMGLVGGLILATWFGWSFATYGARGTLLSNTSATALGDRDTNQLLKIVLNLRDTFVPHFLRPVDGAFLAQRSPWGYWRDWFFQLYQVNLFLIFGSVAWLVLGRELIQGARSASASSRWFWAVFCGGAVFVGVAVHGDRDIWGLAHICLQALVPLGLAYLAARWRTLGRAWRRLLVTGAILDFLLGIALQFGVQSYAFDRWFAGGRTRVDILTSYSEWALINLRAKFEMHYVFLGEALHAPGALVLALLAVILTLSVVRAARRPG